MTIETRMLVLAGGTEKAFIVSRRDSASIAKDLVAALDEIRGAHLGCEFKVPPPPANEKLDYAAVNVIVSSGATADALAYSKDCAVPGWRYDNPEAPGVIRLCPASCTSLTARADAKVSVELGCQTKGTSGTIPR